MNEDDLIERIYEAPFDPQQWSGILEGLSDIAGARGGLVYSFPVNPNIYLVSSGLTDFVARLLEDPRPLTQPIQERLLALPGHGFISNHDAFNAQEREELPIFRDLHRPYGLEHIISNKIVTPLDYSVLFTFMRETAKGPVPTADIARLDRIRPHLARAVTLATRNEFQQIRNANEALGATGLATAAIDAVGRVIDCNTLFSSLTSRISIGAGNRLHLLHPGAQQVLDESLAIMARGEQWPSGAGRTVPLPVGDGLAPAILHILPATQLVRQLFTGTALFVAIAQASEQNSASIDIIESLFDLTAAEARIAQALARGNDVRDIAVSFGISTETVRRHLKNIYSKTGMSRQAELSAAIASLRTVT